MADQETPHFDDTQTAIHSSLPGGTSPPPPQKPAPIAMVEGSRGGMSGELQDLLRWRLRIAALTLFGGFTVFLVYRLFFRDPIDEAGGTPLFIAHILVTVLLGLLGGVLCRHCKISNRLLRLDELVIFGAPAAFFVLMQWYWIQDCVVTHQFVPPVTGPWLMLTFTYALFIPNSWRRAAIVFGAMAVTPVVLMIVLWMTSAACAAAFGDDPSRFVENALLLLIAATVATVGTHTIGMLRQKEFTARQLGQYRLKEKLGFGGMGEVYLAEHQLMKRPCAIKLIRPDKAGDPSALARFEREVKATAKLSHWNTVEIYDYGRAEDGTFYYVMEYLPGLNLSQLVSLHGRLPARRAIHLLTQICEALEEAHRQGLVHRDIKPANVFAAIRGGVYDVVKLLDFGLAKPLTTVAGSEITMEGNIAGSPLFMSPEQIECSMEVDARSDIYSVGVVAYFLLAGVPPHNDENTMRVMMAHVRDDPAPLTAMIDDMPADLDQVVMRCLEKDPELRFQTAEDLYQALSECAAAGGWTRNAAANWWQNNGCPKKKALDLAVMQATNG